MTMPQGVQERTTVTIRFAGDSGDGMQLTGTQFTRTSAIFGNDISTFPDFPAEIRAPAGTLAGVSGFQVHFGSEELHTPGDEVDTLVAFNPAALKTNVDDVRDGGMVIVNEDSFGATDLKKAHYDSNPLEDGSLDKFRLIKVPATKLTQEALKDSPLGNRDKDRCKNFFALGLISWLYGRPLHAVEEWIDQKFGKNPDVASANRTVLHAGHAYGETCEFFEHTYHVSKAKLPPGRYRRISGNEATAIGFIVAGRLAGKDVFYGSYPITPASDVLHVLSRYKHFDVKTFQAEDEIAAVCSSIGASFAGDLGITGTSGPGLALKGEALGLAVMTELPLVVLNVQRGGPSTGLPTKTEQADLFQAMYGRNGECPMVVIAANSPADCFDTAVEACRIAMQHMVPVNLLTDGYIANGQEPWAIPDPDKMAPIVVKHPGPVKTSSGNGNGNGNGDVEPPLFKPYLRDDRLVRPWALPGTEGLQHRIGGLEKADVTGNVNYEPENHEHMIATRQKKVDLIANHIPEQTVMGPEEGDLLVVGWGGTAGALRTAVERVQKQGKSVAHCHIRYLMPFPRNLGDVLKRYKKVLVAELNCGQLRFILRGKFLIDAYGINKVQGKPFLVSELENKINELLSN